MYCSPQWDAKAKRHVSRKLKIKMYKTVVRPVILYPSGTWIINKVQQGWRDGNGKIREKYLEGRGGGEIWVTRTDQALIQLYEEANTCIGSGANAESEMDRTYRKNDEVKNARNNNGKDSCKRGREDGREEGGG